MKGGWWGGGGGEEVWQCNRVEVWLTQRIHNFSTSFSGNLTIIETYYRNHIIIET